MKHRTLFLFFLGLGLFVFLGCSRSVRFESEFRFTDTTPFVKETNFLAHGSYVFYGIFSSNGMYLATGSADRTVRVWDTKTWSSLFVIGESYLQLWGMPLAFSEGDAYLVYGAYETLKVWDMAKRVVVAQTNGHRNGIQTIRRAGTFIVTGGADGFVRIWTVPELALVREVKASSKEIWSVSFDSQKKVLVAGGEDGNVYVFTFPELLPISIKKGHFLPVENVAVIPEGGIFASAGGDGIILFWDEKNPTPLKELRGHIGAVLVLTFLNRKYLASGGEDDMIFFWDWESGKIVGMEKLGADVMALRYDPLTKRLFVGTRVGEIHIWKFQKK